MILLSYFSREVRLLEPPDSLAPLDIRLRFHNVAEALDFLRWSIKDDFQRRRLREILARLEGQVYQLEQDAVYQHIALHLISGALKVVRYTTTAERAMGSLGAAAAAAAPTSSEAVTTTTESKRFLVQKEEPPTPPAVRKQLSWVEIQLVDTAGKPVPGIRYRIELPDGQFQDGTLDETGRARADQIEPGTCWISFPDYDKEVIRPG
jgi:hypothetical protein